MLLGYLFCLKITDQMKYSINESLIYYLYQTIDFGFKIKFLFGMYQMIQVVYLIFLVTAYLF